MAYMADFWELREMLPRDSNGVPDWVLAQKIMRTDFGVTNLRSMTPDQRTELKRMFPAQQREG